MPKSSKKQRGGKKAKPPTSERAKEDAIDKTIADVLRAASEDGNMSNVEADVETSGDEVNVGNRSTNGTDNSTRREPVMKAAVVTRQNKSVAYWLDAKVAKPKVLDERPNMPTSNRRGAQSGAVVAPLGSARLRGPKTTRGIEESEDDDDGEVVFRPRRTDDRVVADEQLRTTRKTTATGKIRNRTLW